MILGWLSAWFPAVWIPVLPQAIANEENDELAFLHVSYGQRTEKRERESFERIADHYRVRSRLVVSLDQLARIGGSSLTDTSIPVTALICLRRAYHRVTFPSGMRTYFLQL
jgi:7-cyano-7-deazaguanine synthase in queuosine biosynthesis